MHKVKAKGILSAANGMNIYRGCQHGCIYCDARSKCYQMNHRFEDIEVKENAPELLENALKRKRRKCMIGTGAMSDPYIPLEKELKLTRRCLEIINRYGFGVTVQTKSASVMRDIDLFTKINDKSKAVLQMTLTTADESLCRIIEPNVSALEHMNQIAYLAPFIKALCRLFHQSSAHFPYFQKLIFPFNICFFFRHFFCQSTITLNKIQSRFKSYNY